MTADRWPDAANPEIILEIEAAWEKRGKSIVQSDEIQPHYISGFLAAAEFRDQRIRELEDLLALYRVDHRGRA